MLIPSEMSARARPILSPQRDVSHWDGGRRKGANEPKKVDGLWARERASEREDGLALGALAQRERCCGGGGSRQKGL